MEFGIRLPAFYLGKKDTVSMNQLKEYVKEAEEVGFNSFWTIEHYLPSPPAYHITWLEPLSLLSTLIPITSESTMLGTLIIVLPWRNPALLANKVATMSHLSDGKFALGVAVGWNPKEFEMMQITKRERGKRTTEILEILNGLWYEKNFSYDGEFYQLQNANIAVKPPEHIPIWMGGGTHILMNEVERKTVDRALRRIARFADGWAITTVATPDMVKNDYKKIKEFAKEFDRDPSEIELMYENFIYITEDESEESKEQAYKKYKTYSDLPRDKIRQQYLVGTPKTIISDMREKFESTDGVHKVVFNPITFERDQLNLLANEIIPRVQQQLKSKD